MFPFCLPFVTPGTEMSLGKEKCMSRRMRAHTHADTHMQTRDSAQSCSVGEVLRRQSYCAKISGRKKRVKQKEEKNTNETQTYSGRKKKDAGNCTN